LIIKYEKKRSSGNAFFVFGTLHMYIRNVGYPYP